MPIIRAKMQVTEVTSYGNQHGSGKGIRLEAVYDPDIPEDLRFAQATPSASLQMHVNSPAAIEQFQPGRTFILAFTPLETAPTV